MEKKSYISFMLWGESAMWRHPSEALGHFSGAGPSPSNIAGIIGAAFGFQVVPTKENPRPISEDLISWLKKTKILVASRLLKKTIRLSTNVNAFKEISGFQTFRLQRRSIDLPQYEIVVEINSEDSESLISALKSPHYSIYLGDSNHPGKIINVKTSSSVEENNWAYKVPEIEMEEYVWNTKIGTNGSRLIRDGYWTYPTPNTKVSSPNFETCLA